MLGMPVSQGSVKGVARVVLSLEDADKIQVRQPLEIWEHSGSVVECLTQDWGAAGSSLIGATVLCPWTKDIYPCLVLVQHSKTRPDVTEKLLTVT